MEKPNSKSVDSTKIRPLPVCEISEAENLFVAFVQGKSYIEEVLALQSEKVVKTSSSLAQLDPFLEDNIIQVGRCIKHSSFPYSLKHPIILSEPD